MNPIQKFEITGMTVSGFKCFAGSEEIEFGPQTIITGGNGRGKSSVADAIAFAVTGLPFFGERGIDRLHAEQNADLFISMRFKDENGEAHELTRSRKKDRMTITCDGREIRQADLTEMFGEKDVFLSILNPLYFIEELGDSGKKLLERYLPDIPQESVTPLLNDDTRALLESEKILSPGSFLSQCRAEIRDLEQSVVYTTGQKDLAESQRRDAAAKVQKLTERLTALEKERGALETHRFEGIDLADAKERLVDLSARYEEMAKETPETAGTAEIDSELREAQDKLAARGAEQYVPKYAGHIAEHSAKVQEAGARYKREAGLLKGFQAGTVCPMCRRGVTENELPALRGELQKEVDAIVAEGKAATAKLEELKELERKSEETFRQFQAEDMEKLNAEIRRLTKQRDESLAAAAAYQEQRKTEMDKSMPSTQESRRLLASLVGANFDLKGIPGFYTRYGDWTLAGPNGFLIPVRNKDGLIQGMKIRLDDEADPARKYRWLSSRSKKLRNGSRSYSWIHVTGNRTSKRAFLTEGPLKGDVASFLANDALFICTGGVNAIHGLRETIIDLGVTEVVEAMDMDQMVNKQVRDAILTMRKEVMGIPSLKYSKYSWNPAYKGVDDYFLSRVAVM